MKVTVLGATGFIGRHLCDACVERGDFVTAFLRNASANDQFIQYGVRTVIGSLVDEQAITRACEGSDLVFNLAGVLGKWGKSNEELHLVNARTPGLVTECASHAGAGKVVLVSTAGVSGPLPDGVDGSESDEPQPQTEYQKTKYAGESAALDAHQSTGIPLVITRPSFVYGPGDTHKLSLFRMVAAGRMILVNGGKSRLHPVFVDDVVRGILLASDRAAGNGEVYIIAGERAATTRELVEAIALSIGITPPKNSLPEGLLLGVAGIAEAVGRVAHREPPLTRSKVKLLSENYAYKIDKAKSELQFTPSIGLVEGITRTVECYKSEGLVHAN